MQTKKYDMIILDEINNAQTLNLITEKQILTFIKKKPTHTELILTGRHTTPNILKKANLATKMTQKKHYYNNTQTTKNTTKASQHEQA